MVLFIVLEMNYFALNNMSLSNMVEMDAAMLFISEVGQGCLGRDAKSDTFGEMAM
jgi:hypothetical protein